MTPEAAARLARRLLAAFPTDYVSRETTNIYGERLLPMDEGTASRAIERLIDSARRLPTIAELRDAVGAEGGDVPDPGRRMSPRTEPLRRLSPEQQRAVRVRVRELAEGWRAGAAGNGSPSAAKRNV